MPDPAISGWLDAPATLHRCSAFASKLAASHDYGKYG
jgi:hypothetical protein